MSSWAWCIHSLPTKFPSCCAKASSRHPEGQFRSRPVEQLKGKISLIKSFLNGNLKYEIWNMKLECEVWNWNLKCEKWKVKMLLKLLCIWCWICLLKRLLQLSFIINRWRILNSKLIKSFGKQLCFNCVIKYDVMKCAVKMHFLLTREDETNKDVDVFFFIFCSTMD